MPLTYNTSKQIVPFNPDEVDCISFLDADISKFHLLKTSDRQNKTVYIRCYNNKAFALRIDTPPEDVRGENRFVTYGLKKSMKWDEKTNAFTQEWTGEYELGVKLISNINDTNKSVFESASVTEKKLIDVLDGIRNAVARDLVAFDELSEIAAATMVRPLYSRTVMKDGGNKPIKSKGLPVFDETKSPTLNLKCQSRLAPGIKFEKGKDVRPEDRLLTTKFIKPSPTGDQTYTADQLLNYGACKGIYIVRFGYENLSKSGWGAKCNLISAVLTPLVKKQQDFGERQLAMKYSFIDNTDDQDQEQIDE